MKPVTIWEIAAERESETGGGMPAIFNFLVGIHPETDAARADLSAAWQRYNEQMNEWARTKGGDSNSL